MNKDIDVHPVQARILRELLFKPEAKFAELNVLELPTDHFTFHLKSLVEARLVEKIDNGYKLTPVGKEFANRFDTDSEKVTYEQQAKVGVVVCGVKKEAGKTYYLFQQRLKQPYYGYLGFVTGKIRKGETVFETAQRELWEETGLSGKLSLVGIEHKMDYSFEDELLEDKFFFIFAATETEGELIESFEGGKNQWLSESEIMKALGVFPDVIKILKMVQKKSLSFSEEKYQVSGF